MILPLVNVNVFIIDFLKMSKIKACPTNDTHMKIQFFYEHIIIIFRCPYEPIRNSEFHWLNEVVGHLLGEFKITCCKCTLYLASSV